MMGWKLEGIPWFLLPFVIAVIGVENMVHVTRAVLSTSISLPVSERLSLGLAQSGPTITFTTLSDIGLFAVLGIVVGERVGAVRDFCTFTIIVLISDWFLIFAFFATVISIDMHRLELADVLGQQPVPTIVHTGGLAVRGSPSPSPNPTTSTTGRRRRSKRTKSSSQVLRSGFQAILRARTARNGTLVALVTVLVGLWYYYSGSFDLAPHDHHPALVAPSVWTVSHGLVGGEPRILGHDDEEGGVDFLGGSSSSSSSRARLWDLLNPNHHKEEFTFVVPSPTAIIISTIPHRIKPSDLVPPSRSSRSFTHFAKPFYWFIKVVVLPISITTFALYLLLLFLLKDAELLDAQRDRLEIGEEWEDEVDARRAMKKHGGQETEGSGNMVPPSMRRVVGLHQADVCLIGTSEDGEVIMSVGFDGIALVSKTGDPTVIQRLLFTVTSSSDRPILAAVDAKGSFCAVALSKGSVFVWSLDPTSLNPTPIAFSSSSSSSDLGPSNVSDMSFLPRSNGSPRDDVFSVAVSNSSILVVVREDGSLFEYRCIEKEIRVGLLPGEDSIRATCLWRTGRQDVSEVSFASSSSGRVDFLRRDDAGSWTEVASITPVQALESISHVTSAVVQVEGSSREVVAVASSSGVVSIWDVSEGPESIFTLTTDSKARITQIRVVDPILQQCGSCQERFGGFLLLVSTSESLSVHRISPRSLPATCNCSSIRRTSSSSEPRSSLEVPPPSSRRRGSSVSFAPPLSPGGTPKRLPSSPSAQSILSADYPMYVHGAHLKRLSNRQAGGSGRSEGVEDQEEVLLDESGSPTKEQPGRPSSPWSALREYLLGTVSIHRGGWEVLDRRRVVGFGKGSTTLLSSVTEEDDDMISETQSHSSSSSRWQIFQIDLSQPTNGPLLALSVSDLTSLRPTSPSSSSLDFNTNSPQPSSNPTSSSSTSLSTKPALLAVDTSEGSSLRRRRAERLKQFASQNLETPPPSVSHALIGPLVAAGSDRILAGTGNTIGAFVFSPLEREGESSAIGGGGAGGGSGSGIVGGGLGVGGSGMGVPSPLRRRVEKPRDF
ncbi:sterol-sensing domain of SREBP cleavage-activation-domain-containing protein [Mrakia frigida]|uniref:sterol-sensing domain of SREBP cleavage-activation-domain-containing protein n=1 Tax=Mrakia frigida TaxID=29902 RepID=UPI003FCC170F